MDFVFHEYQQTPEYQKVNAGMSLPEFQRIFWWEYWHRLLARSIGLVFFLPMAWFWLRQALPGWLKLRLVDMLLLGGLQGAMGWYMVQSGLVDNPRVSHYRLAAHLGLAFLLFGWLLWTTLDLARPVEGRPWSPARRSLQRFGTLLMALAFVMALSGALVAGLRAGLVYNTFPLMDGGLVPPGALMLSPWLIGNLQKQMLDPLGDWRKLKDAYFAAGPKGSAERKAFLAKNPILKQIWDIEDEIDEIVNTSYPSYKYLNELYHRM